MLQLLWGAATTSVAEHREQLENLKQEYDDIKSKLDSYNSDLASVKDRMAELAAKDNLTFTEKEEYDNLVKQNNELQRTVDLLEEEEKLKKKELNIKFVETMEADVDNGDFDYTINSTDGETYYYDNENDYLTGQAEERSKLVVAKNNAKTDEEKESIQDQIDEIDSYFKENLDAWKKDAEGIEYIATPTTEDEKKVNEWLDFINDNQDKIAIAMGGNNSKTNAFNRLVDNWAFDESLQALQDLGAEGEVTAEKLKEYQGDAVFDDFVDKLVELGVIDSASNLEDIALAFNSVAESADAATKVVDASITALSKTQSLSQGINQISKIYKDIKDGVTFDYSSILNNESFTNTFSGYTAEYENFIKTISNSPNDIDACQDSINQLLTAYIHGSGALENLTEETKGATVAMLEQMGVANADTIVTQALARNMEKVKAEEFRKTQTLDFSKLKNADNFSFVSSMMQAAEQAGVTKAAYAQLLAEEVMLNSNTWDVSQKLQALSQISKSATGAAFDLELLNDVMSGKSTTSKREFAEQNGIEIDETSRKIKSGKNKGKKNWKYIYNGVAYETLDEAYLAKKQDELTDSLTNAQIDSVQFDGGSSAEETKESFNWIETALSRIQRTISNLGKTVSATYKSWGERNSALAQQMSTVSHEIDLQNQAYAKYMSLANSVSLSEGYKQLVREGAIRYDDESIDSDTATKIKEYQEYYEAALAAEDARIDLEAEQMNLIQTNFDNIAKQYDDQLSLIEHEANSLNSSIDMIEKEGHVVTEDLYKSLIQNADQQMALLQNKAIELKSAMNSVATGTEMWYSLNSQLLSIEEEMDSIKSSTIEWNNSIRDLEWENFDRILEKMAAVNSEADFLMELLADEDMYNDDGSITDAGRATMGLHATNYNSKMAQASEISKELRALNSDYANDSENLTYLERRNELEQQYRDLILDAKDDEQSLIDMQKEQYDALLDHMSEVIDKRKDMLSKAKDAYDYEKNIAEQTEEVAKLEKQLSAYQGDTSEESRATIQQLKVSLADARENLEETQYEKYISDQEAMLDSLYDETEEWINARLDDEALLLEGILSAINDNAGLIRDTLESTAYGAGTTLSGGISEYLTPSNIVSQTVEPNVQYAELMAQLQTTAAQLQFNLPSLPSYDVALPSNSSVNNVTINGLSLEFPNVQTPDEWVTYLQHDKRFENIILEITDGNNSLSKYKW